MRKARQQTNGVLGVNIMVAIREFTETARAAIEEGVDVIFAGAGLPLNLPACLTEQAKTKLVPIVSSAKAARLIAKRWMSRYHYAPDAFVLEGPKAGGHLGFALEEITSRLISWKHCCRRWYRRPEKSVQKQANPFR